MSKTQQLTSLQAKSPFEMRVNLGRDLPESDVRTALATGDMGFLHSFTTGSAVDGPGVRVVAWTAGCQFRCLYCHNPDTWTISNGIPVTIAKFAAGLGNVERVDVLPFHQMGRYKWKELKLDYTLNDVRSPTHEAVEHACTLFRDEGLKAF